MNKVIAALDASLAAQPVLRSAIALGEALGAEVEAVHVQEDDERVPRTTAAEHHVDLRVEHGPVAGVLVDMAQAEDVRALVLGARGSRLSGRPLGGTALAVATSLSKPVLVVPPDARHPGTLRRVLVPLEGRAATRTPREIIALVEGVELDVFTLHVLGEEALPLFTDQPQHEHPALVDEMLRRFCPWGIGVVRFEVRVGRPEEVVPLVAEQEDVDVIALGWSQELAADREPVVRAVLDRAHVPALLVPLQTESEGARAAGALQTSLV
jgi:nucleotide-binding universal stress UspA family protein